MVRVGVVATVIYTTVAATIHLMMSGIQSQVSGSGIRYQRWSGSDYRTRSRYQPLKSTRSRDHLLGFDPMHSHDDGEADHDHDHDDLGGEYDPTTSSLWAQDNIDLVSVGIDIGSAGNAGDLLARAPAASGRGADEPLFRGPARDAVPITGRAHPVHQRRAHRRQSRSAESSTLHTNRLVCIPITSTQAR